MRLTRPAIKDASGATNVRQLGCIMNKLGFAGVRLADASAQQTETDPAVPLSKAAKKALKNADHLLK